MISFNNTLINKTNISFQQMQDVAIQLGYEYFEYGTYIYCTKDAKYADYILEDGEVVKQEKTFIVGEGNSVEYFDKCSGTVKDLVFVQIATGTYKLFRKNGVNRWSDAEFKSAEVLTMEQITSRLI